MNKFHSVDEVKIWLNSISTFYSDRLISNIWR